MADPAPVPANAAAAADPGFVREYTLRLAPPEEGQQRRFVGSFPLGPPGFREKRRGKWAMTEQEAPGAAPRAANGRRLPRPKEWTLVERDSGAAHHGTVEAGMSSGGPAAAAAANGAGASGGTAAGSSATASGAGCYFLLTRRGADFVVQPVHEWHTFRPVNARRGGRTLEEAEAAMAGRGTAAGPRAMPRLAELAAAGPVDEEAMAGGDQGRDSEGEGDGADSDVEGALGRLTTKGSPTGAAANGKAAKGGGAKPAAGRGSSKAGRRLEQGEDWEYEDDRPDDDLEMGKDDDADMPAPRRQPDDSDEEGPQLSGSSDGDGPKQLSASGAALQKLLRKTGLDDGSDAEDTSEDHTPTPGGTPAPAAGYADDDLDDEDDEEFLQNMARQEAARQSGKAPGKQEQPKAAPAAGGGAVKPAPSAARGKRKGEPDLGDQASTKKAKGSAATGPAQGALAAAGAAASPDDTTPAPPPTQSEIVEWLRAAGPVAMGELTRRFKKRLRSDAQRKTFGATIKKIAVHKEVTPGAGKVILLKPGV